MQSEKKWQEQQLFKTQSPAIHSFFLWSIYLTDRTGFISSKM